MGISIQVLSTSVETKPTTKGSYQQLEVAYKNLSFQGKVEAKKLMSFGANAEAFKVLSTASAASTWDVEIVKNDKGYNDWIRVTKSNGTSSSTATHVSSSPTTGATTVSGTTKGGWETPEERAKKQIYIVRQSSISAAVNALSVGVKTSPKAEDVIEYARQLEAFVFESDKVQATVSKDVGSIEELDEDLPY